MKRTVRRAVRKVLASLCMLAMTFTSVPKPAEATAVQQTEAEEETKGIFYGNTFQVEYQLDGKWEKGYNASIKITNTGKKTIENWALLYYSEDNIQNLWNGKQIKNEYGITMIKNAEWNQDIKPGETVNFGFTAAYEEKIHIPKSYALSTRCIEVPEKDYKIIYHTDSDWNSGYSSSIGIRNLTGETIEDWDLRFDFAQSITNIWNAEITDQKENTYFLKNNGYNQNITADGQTYLGFNGVPGGIQNAPKNYILHKYTTEIDPDLDSDSDRIPNIYELMTGTNSYLSDTDGDGLSDFIEIFKISLDPLKKDTDGNGMMDGDEDTDEDGFTNREEVHLGTEPGDVDTDGDELSDGDEVNKYTTDPKNDDTDGDSLTDGDDIILGFSPLKKDTDDNGITDDKEKIEQSLTESIEETNNNDGAVTGVTVKMDVSGNIQNNTEIENVFGEDILSSELAGLVGVPVSITTDGTFDEATLTFSYDPAKLGANNEDDLAVMWYDEANEDYVIYDEETVIDKQNHTASYTTTHFSKYMLVNKKTWYQAWRNEVNYYKTEKPRTYSDLVFAVDISGSMVGPELRQAKNAMKGIVNAKRGKDRCNIVTFAGKAELVRDFTNNTEKLKKSIDEMKAEMENKTNVDKGLKKAIAQYSKTSYKDKGNTHYVVLICDGDMEYNKEIVEEAKKNDVAIITILIGAEGEADLKKVSKETGGKFYSVGKLDSIANLLFELQKDTLGELDKTDSDKDGLYNVYEKHGMLCQNGKIYKSNPYSPDGDFDGVSDYEEMGGLFSVADGVILRKKKIRVPKTEEWIEASYFWNKSRPDKRDTDGDEYTDKADKNPNRKDVKLLEIKRKEYVPVMIDNNVSYGGNQGWWGDVDSLFKKKGCGKIAGADVLLYLGRNDKDNQGKLSKDAYIRFVDVIRTDYIHFIPVLNEITALDISRGMNRYFNNESMNTKAVSFPFAFSKSNRKKLKKLIRHQIEKDYPVILSAGCKMWGQVSDDKKPKMYIDTKGRLTSLEEDRYKNCMYNHYVVITGVLTDRQSGRLRYKISSWGQEYFIDYDEICQYMDNYGTDWTSDAVFLNVR